MLYQTERKLATVHGHDVVSQTEGRRAIAYGHDVARVVLGGVVAWWMWSGGVVEWWRSQIYAFLIKYLKIFICRAKEEGHGDLHEDKQQNDSLVSPVAVTLIRPVSWSAYDAWSLSMIRCTKNSMASSTLMLDFADVPK